MANPLSQLTICQEPWCCPPYTVGHGVRLGVPPSVGRDTSCLLAQMSCFTDEGTEMPDPLTHQSPNLLSLCQAWRGIPRSTGCSPCLQARVGDGLVTRQLPCTGRRWHGGAPKRLGPEGLGSPWGVRWQEGLKGCPRGLY